MVHPSDNWEEKTNGYQCPNCKLRIAELHHNRSDEVNKWAVDMFYGTQHQRILGFKDPRLAWEAAKILTHYIDRLGGPMPALADMRPSYGEEREIHLGETVEDMRSREAIEKLLGGNAVNLEECFPQEEGMTN
ncbi:hypothetical protein [Halorarius halobius]|uniref:hypothetical protein n=1 Tax=Halorarius halobius TaxID=2962671 RepID=UPI0020CFC855|nr:hypothetical protein [Halorarius halobius]